MGNQRDIYFHNLLGIKWHMQTGGNALLSGQQKTTKRSGWACYKGRGGKAIMDYALWLF